RPRFMQKDQKLTAAKKGTVMHSVMQHVDLNQEITPDYLKEKVAKMVVDELLSEEEAQAVELERIVQFFQSRLGKRMLQADKVEREVPFSLMLDASEAYRDWTGPDDSILVQGVIDCLLEEPDGLVLVDYKTDMIGDRFVNGFSDAKSILADRYRVQLDMYARAVEQIRGQPLKEKF